MEQNSRTGLLTSKIATEKTAGINKTLTNILRQSAVAVPYDTACVMLVVEDDAQIVHAEGYEKIDANRENSIFTRVLGHRFSLPGTPNLGQILRERQPLVIADVQKYPGWVDLPTAYHVRSWMGVPVIIDDELVAIFSLDKMEPDFYQPAHVDQFTPFAEQAAVALKNEHLLIATRRQLSELTALHAIAAAGTEATSIDGLIKRATHIIGETLYPDNFGFLLVDREREVLVTHKSYRVKDGPENRTIIRLDEGVTGQVASSGIPVRIDDARQVPHYIPASDSARSELCVPIIIQDKVFGVINAENSSLSAFTPADERLLITIASQLATAIERIQLFEEESWRRHVAETLREATATLLFPLELDELLETILKNLETVVAFNSASILLLEGDELRIVAGRGFPDESIIGFRFPAAKPLFLQMQSTRKPIYLPDVREDDHFLQQEPVKHIRSWIGAPLIARGEVIGELTVDYSQPNYYTTRDIQMTQAFANHAALAISNARHYEAAQQGRYNAETLARANQMLGTVLDPDAIYGTLMEALTRLIPHETNTVLIREGDIVSVRQATGYGDGHNIYNVTFDINENRILRHVFVERRSILIKDVRSHADWEYREGNEHILSWLGVPLIANGEVVACLSIEHKAPYGLTIEHLKIAEVVAAQASFALHNSQLLSTTRRNAHEMQVISEVLQLLNATPDVLESFAEIAVTIKHLTGAFSVALVEVDEIQGKATILATEKAINKHLRPGLEIPLSDSSALRAIAADKLHISDDLSLELDNRTERMLFKAGIRSRTAIPLRVRHSFHGGLLLGWRQPAGYNPKDVSILNQVAGALSLALERTRLYKESAAEARRLATLHELAHQMTGLLDSEQLCRLVAERLINDYGYFNTSVFLINDAGTHLNIIARAGAHLDRYPAITPENAAPLGRGLIGRAAQTGQTQLAQETAQSVYFHPLPGIDVQSELAIPLLVGQDVIGVLNVDAVTTYAFRPRDIPLLKTVADYLAVAVEKARLFEETRRRAIALAAITEVSAALREARSVADVLHTILNRASQLLNACTGTIFVREANGDGLHPLGSFPEDNPARPGQIGHGFSGQVFQWGEAFISEDLNDSAVADLVDEETAQLTGARSAIVLPLHAGERIIGVLFIGLPQPHVFSSSERRLAATLAELAGNAIDRAMILETLEQRVEARTAELAEANQQLQELDRLKTKFVSDVSHELRTPITSLSLYIDLLRRSDPDRQSHYLDILRQQIDRLSTLIEDVLSLSRLDKGYDHLQLGPVDLNQVIHDVVKAHESEQSSTGITLNLALAAPLPPVHGEQNQLAQIVTHLFANALHFTPQGSIFIRTSYQAEDQVVQLEVHDTGVGIPEADIPHVFDRFFRGSNTIDLMVPGGGLGLAIVKEIVALHQGQLLVESRLGQGSTFTVMLPVSQVPAV